MHPGRPRGAAERAGDLGVLHPLLHAKQEDLALQSRQSLQTFLEQPPGLIGSQLTGRIGTIDDVVLLDLEENPAFVLAKPILQDVSSDPKKPATKRALTTPAIESAECLEEAVLNEIVYVGGGGSCCRQIASQGWGMTAHELARREFVTTAPCCDQFGIGHSVAARCWHLFT
jgi:hypothetical protein